MDNGKLQQLFRDCLCNSDLWEVCVEGKTLTYKLDTRLVISKTNPIWPYRVIGDFSDKLEMGTTELFLMSKLFSELHTDTRDKELEESLLQGIGKVRPKPAEKPPTKVVRCEVNIAPTPPPPRCVKGGKPSMPKPPQPIEREEGQTIWQSFKAFLFYKGD